MIDQVYCGEIEDMLTQFVAAFDNARIIRSRKDSDVQEIIVPRWVVAGKPRVFYDIINQAKNITLPVVVVEPQSIKLRQKSLENKNLPQSRFINGLNYQFKQPTPVDVTLSVTFYSRYLSDIWQMGSNFMAFATPYTYITVPNPVIEKEVSEAINCKVTWDGGYSIKYSNPVNHDDNWLVSATAGFTIEGFIFQKPVQGGKVITSIENEVVPCTYNMLQVTYNSAGESNIESPEITYTKIKGWPSVTNVKYAGYDMGTGDVNNAISLFEKTTVLDGHSFFTSQNTGVIIKTDNELDLDCLEKISITTIKHGEISGYNILPEYLQIAENEIKILPITGFKNEHRPVQVFVYNNAGFTNAQEAKNLTFFI